MNLSEDLQIAVRETGALVRRTFPWWLKPFLLRGVAGITLGRRIYLAAGAQADGVLRHELVHVRQIARIGMLRFYGQWVWEYVRNRLKGMSPDEAYRRISFEEEAFSAEHI